MDKRIRKAMAEQWVMGYAMGIITAVGLLGLAKLLS
jgi:hypothetical protein